MRPPDHSPSIEAPVHQPYGEYHPNTMEAFIPLAQAEELVVAAMSNRVDHATGRLLPIEEEYMLMNGPGYMSKPLPSGVRHDVVLPEPPREQPYHDGGTLHISQKYSVSGELYDGLTGEHNLSLSAADRERLAYERSRLEHTLKDRPDLTWKLDDENQPQDAYHIKRTDGPAPGSDGQLISPVRVYAMGGAEGVRIANQVINAGADFAGAKVWTPQVTSGEQDFRADTPIFIANTAAQLHSILMALRPVAARGLLPTDMPPAVGLSVEGIPGVFIAQPPVARKSFNSKMARFWAEPIRQACNSLPLHAGDAVNSSWVSEAAFRARALAIQHAQNEGVNPECHALLPGQDINVIKNAMRLER